MMSFLSTSSARRTTAANGSSPRRPEHFYPRPPRGGRRAGSLDQLGESNISIHVLREEDDDGGSPSSGKHGYFYPRPPRGGRLINFFRCGEDQIFLSTSSARRTTRWVAQLGEARIISIHVLREEDDKKSALLFARASGFLSTSSARRTTC